MKTGRAIVVSAGCLAGLLFISEAWAVTSGYSGMTCRYSLGTSLATSFPFLEWSIARHNSPSAATFYCSAVQLGGAVTAWRVGVRDITPVGEVRCFARTTGEFDIGGFISASEGSGVDFMGLKTLGVGIAGTSGYIVNGSKLIQCNMPPASGFDGSAVASYSITEL